jgi:hypothetical protein
MENLLRRMTRKHNLSAGSVAISDLPMSADLSQLVCERLSEAMHSGRDYLPEANFCDVGHPHSEHITSVAIWSQYKFC